jgi:hypothetical protein
MLILNKTQLITEEIAGDGDAQLIREEREQAMDYER